MAINDPRKRYSILNYDEVGAAQMMIFQSGIVVEGDRYHFMGLYSGITLAEPSTIELWFMEASQPIFIPTQVIGY